MARTEGRWAFDYCTECALDDDGDGPWDAGVGCPADGPSLDCAAVWKWIPNRAARSALPDQEVGG